MLILSKISLQVDSENSPLSSARLAVRKKSQVQRGKGQGPELDSASTPPLSLFASNNGDLERAMAPVHVYPPKLAHVSQKGVLFIMILEDRLTS